MQSSNRPPLSVSCSYDEKSTTITITGEGATRDFGGEGMVDPFASVRATVTSIVVEKGVTGLGAGIFAGCTALTSIKIGNADQVLTLGEGAIPANKGLEVDFQRPKCKAFYANLTNLLA